MVRTVWLVDATPGTGSLEQGCTAFADGQRLLLMRLSELTKIFGSGAESEKNDCNLSKKQV